MSKARFWSLMFMTIGLGTLVAVVVQQWAFGAMGQELSRRIRTQLFRAILYQEVRPMGPHHNVAGPLLHTLRVARVAVGRMTRARAGRFSAEQ